MLRALIVHRWELASERGRCSAIWRVSFAAGRSNSTIVPPCTDSTAQHSTARCNLGSWTNWQLVPGQMAAWGINPHEHLFTRCHPTAIDNTVHLLPNVLIIVISVSVLTAVAIAVAVMMLPDLDAPEDLEETKRSVNAWIEESEHSGANSDDGMSTPSHAGACDRCPALRPPPETNWECKAVTSARISGEPLPRSDGRSCARGLAGTPAAARKQKPGGPGAGRADGDVGQGASQRTSFATEPVLPASCSDVSGEQLCDGGPDAAARDDEGPAGHHRQRRPLGRRPVRASPPFCTPPLP